MEENTNIEVQVGAEETKATEKTFTQAELDAIIEKRLAKERAKFEERLTAKVSEAEKLAKLSEEERAKAEIDIAKGELTAMRAEFDKMRAEFDREQLLSQVTKELADRKLPIGMAQSLLGVDAEATKANIDKFESDWKSSLEDAVKAEIKGSSSSPRLELKGEEGITKNPKDMSLAEFTEYFNNKK